MIELDYPGWKMVVQLSGLSQERISDETTLLNVRRLRVLVSV
ncbi:MULTISPECIES: hypothetical protein [Pseudomonas]|nr:MULTISPECIES: hypothetical protein [Pseudomonas]WAB89968.1 hypothetical protein OSS47_17585 [Pseudomonas citronellolis]